MIPFFVVDRPISLEIIKGIFIPPGKKIGLMAHANTSPNFRQAFKEYPSENAVKMCDSAIFHPDRGKNTYKHLFDKYEEMGADYGIVIDVLRDAKASIESAKNAIKVFNESGKYTFKLVAVAQGNNKTEFLDCYRELKKLGFEDIAVGGLLHKVETSARYIKVNDELLMESVLKDIRKEFDPSWLFVLGCLHPSRLELFKKLNVWGDYKGWIFEYKKRDEALKHTINKFRTNHLNHTTKEFFTSKLYKHLIKTLDKREKLWDDFRVKHELLLEAKKTVKNIIEHTYQKTRLSNEILAEKLSPLRTRGLLKPAEQGLILGILKKEFADDDTSQKLANCCIKAREVKISYDQAEVSLQKLNLKLLKILKEIKIADSVDLETETCASAIADILSQSEQQFRIDQVQTFISEKILSVI